ncbi:MAG TPA: undecaprenyldiphospho-muramoylpentapeptide beta-N-acetylglucosaminyltransferase [Candidatus Onthousia faecigallinarum]|nr:undecaprenyldiphospho-muramoylpentapeptide beta-N-acetylglucosaminyltransferase [Candidatus Onthousia faecigallinarum]
MRVIITAGGTGGHIYPALAILNKIKEKESKSEFLYIGTTDRMESEIVPSKGIPYLGIEMKGLDRKHPWKNFKVFTIYLKAIKQAKEAIKDFKPDLVIGVGGYITTPVIYAAKKLGYKTMIHEQNAIPGVSNKILSHYADRILVSFEESKESFPKSKTVYTGNPRSEEITKLKAGDKRDLGFSPSKKLVIIVMGSLGSMTMTQKLKELIPSFASKPYEVLLVTGKNYYQDYQSLKIPKNVKIVSFYDAKYMKSCDLIITRSGASTIAEITALALPSIMVPSPYVTHNHQMKNALALEKLGACKIIAEENFSAKTVLPAIDSILNDEEQRKNMQEALKKIALTDSANRIYQEAKKLVRDEKK